MHSLTAEAATIQSMFGRVARRYDWLNFLLSGGNDIYWRWRLTRTVRVQRPERVLDLATGSGDVMRALQRGGAFTGKCVGADFCEPMLRVAQQKGLAPLCVADGLKLPFGDGSFDAVTIAFGLRNWVDRAAGLAEMRRVLKPGGRLYVLEFSHPLRPLDVPYFWYLRRVLPSVAGWCGADRSAYDYLAATIEAFPRQETLSQLLEKTGFKQVTFCNLTFGIVALHCGVA